MGLAFATPAHADDGTGENWSYSSSQSSVSLQLTTPNGVQANVPGDKLVVSVSPVQVTWDVWTSDQGNVSIQNLVSAPITNGSLTWAVTSGNGFFFGTPPSGLSSDGSPISTTVQMGSSEDDVLVTLTSNGVQASQSVHLSFVNGEQWNYITSQAVLNVSLSTTQDTTSVPTGANCPLSVHADYITWDIWQSSTGETTTQNYQTAPASNGPGLQRPGHLYHYWGWQFWNHRSAA